MYQILGMEVRAGKFKAKDTGTEIAYNNLVLHVMGEDFGDSKDCFRCGSPVETLKVKNDEEHIKSTFGKVPTADEMKSYIGQYINVYYNKYGNLDKVEVIKTPSKS